MARLLRHRQTKGAATDRPILPPPRHIPTLPIYGLRRRHSVSSALPQKADIKMGAALRLLVVESGCGAVAVGSAYLFPPLSSGGASIAEPFLRFHTPLIEPDVRY